MKSFTGYIIIVLVIAAAVTISKSLYVVYETEQVILTQFGRPMGDPITDAGLHVRIPFIQKANRIDDRILEWDGSANDMPTKDKLYITVDTFARWRIQDPLQYFLRLRDERSAQSRLDDILGSETRNAVAKHKLIELIRTTKEREPEVDETIVQAGQSVALLLPIYKGRHVIEEEIMRSASGKLSEFGIELMDVRFKRINYNANVRAKIYDRMIAERMQIANRFRSEGQGEAESILGDMKKELEVIESEAYKKIQIIEGQADAQATEIYALSYNESLESVGLYEFVKSLETYRIGLDENTVLILSTDSELMKYFKGIQPGKD
ncbi:MAG: protease modulator HflC [Verrucomicrobia bacterium]|nr:protease modulator HflC [Verrucomicrobiota bacterium]MDA1088348.1 protease modulator HflC [Verrucomicrobiota bacterium]